MKLFLHKYPGIITLLVCLLLTASSASAQNRKSIVLKKTLDGAYSQLAKDSVLEVSDSAFYNPALAGKLDTPYKVRNIVTFRINEYSNKYLPDNFQATASIRVYYHGRGSVYDSVDQSLVINYDTAHPYTMRSSFVFNSAQKVKVKVLDIAVPAGMLEVLQLDNEMEVQPVYKLSCTDDAVQTISFQSPAEPKPDELQVYWPVVQGADGYDLEWTYVDSSTLASGRFGLPLNAALVFDNNTTRVSLAENTYAIPLMYDGKGKLFFRVRAVQVRENDQRVETVWSSQFAGGTGEFEFGGHETGLNWQSNIVFAEDGKRKVVTEYYDGSLRGRQTVTKDNTTGTTVVAENFYDYQGRSTIQVMPAPTLDRIIKYTPRFNNDINGAEYDKDHYDLINDDEEYLTGSAAPMGKSSGANQYYSDNNPLKSSGIHQFIPDGEGRAFTQTEYTQDNTGRISRQSGVGPTFKLGSNHETKYYYNSATQEDLDAIFGTEAGLAYHYFKNTVVDANGQMSVSYLDMQGRTVATALVSSPESAELDDLPGKEEIVVTDSLSGSKKNIVQETVIQSHHSQTVGKAGTYQFKYQLVPPVFTKKDCNNNTICYSGIYDLHIRITDNVKNLHLGGRPYDTIIRNFHPDSLVTDCSAPRPINVEFSLYLERGSYEITKTLTVNQEALAYYRDSVFMASNVCTTLEEMVEQEKVEQRTAACVPDCQTCLDGIGDWNTYRARYMSESGIPVADTAAYRSEAQAAYNSAIAACDDLCDKTNIIDKLRQLMLLDMTPPSGQYARLEDRAKKYSIFYSEGAGVTPVFQQPGILYTDETGRRDTVNDPLTGVRKIPQELTAESFVSTFNPSWAENLLRFHPEYCRLAEYEKFRQSVDWEKKFESTDTYSEAKALGFLNPTNLDSVPFPHGNDPLAVTTAYRNALNDSLNRPWAKFSAWSTAGALVKCDLKDNQCFFDNRRPQFAIDSTAMCAADRDMAWRHFRGMYLNARKNIIGKVVNDASCPVSTRDLAFNYEPRIQSPGYLMSESGIGNITGGNMSEEALRQMANEREQQMYSDNCDAWIAAWIQQLAPCNYPASDIKDIIIPRLKEVCRQGADRDHPRGASTVKPSSTYRYRSFEDVINEYNTQHGITNSLQCNPQLITMPLAYGKQPPGGDKLSYNKPEDCECRTLQGLNLEYGKLATAADTTLAAYINRTRKANVSQTNLNILLDACSPGGMAECHYLPSPVAIPVLIQCRTAPPCVSCEEVKLVYDQYLVEYPDMTPDYTVLDSLQLAKNDLFTRYMNNRFGYGKQGWEYIGFMDSCDVPGPIHNEMVCVAGDSASRKLVSAYTNGGSNVINDIQRTADNGYILAGSTTVRGSGGKDGYIIKTDSLGNFSWAKTFGAEMDDEFTRLKVTPNGSFIITGSTYSYCYDRGAITVLKLDSSGNMEWNRVVDFGETHGGKGTDVLPLKNGHFAFAGLRTATGVSTDWVTGVFSADGELKWMNQTGSTAPRQSLSLLENVDTLYAASSIMDGDNYDAVVLRLDKNTGAALSFWQYDLEGRDNISGNLIKTSSGYKVAMVNLTGAGSTNGNGVLMDVTGAGVIANITKLESPGSLDAQSFTVTPALDGGYYAAQSYQDVYWHKLRADNTVQWTKQSRNGGTDRLRRILQDPDGTLAGAGEYNDQSALLMLAGADGRSGCSDTASALGSTDITVSGIRKTIAFQQTLALSSRQVSMVNIIETTLTPDRLVMNCPGLDTCYAVNDRIMLCGNAAPVFFPVELENITNCTDSTYFAVSAGSVKYNYYVDSVTNDFVSGYVLKALEAERLEKFSVTYTSSEYHYTLYYYDQAGNLVKTVPPAGVVKRRERSWLDSVAVARRAGERLVPPHGMVTQYRYNTLNKLVAQKTPDAGIHHFWYDRLGRIAASQNAEQVLTNKYSYTLYDGIGRITEGGELTSGNPMTEAISRSVGELGTWLTDAGSSKTYITRTVYDLPHTPFAGLALDQVNLRNRVSWAAVYDNASELAAGDRASGSFYSYDILGNVNTLVQDYNSRTTSDVSNRFKKITYEYDLVSGKVNQVNYQPGQVDAFYHRYSYDAENRLVNTETSRDSVYWENEAYYQYFKHGHLARTVMGQQQVQGLDYTYSLQGWLKGVNATALTPDFDMGQDGKAGGITARDAVGFALNYYGIGDYQSVNSLKQPFAQFSGFKPLYNGNISAMSVNNPKAGEALLYGYSYDVLNRITRLDAAKGLTPVTNTWNPIAVSDFAERITYDPNGNILRYIRNGNQTWANMPLEMDKLHYHYLSGTNRLGYITDSVPSNAYDEDIDEQLPSNYSYDQVGNLTQDQHEGITVEWLPMGKIKKVLKGDTLSITYRYDVAGNRISKLVNGVETRYIRDASGNVMSIYVEEDNNYNNGKLTQREVHLYGSNRIGLSEYSTNVEDGSMGGTIVLPNLGTGINSNFRRREKIFELSNHLGNVLATVRDSKAAVDNGAGVIDYYVADVLSAQDYYPFGMQMVGRSFSSGKYRYGFNGKENDNEIKGEGNQQDYGMRIYDPRIGRFLSVDPLTKSFPFYSPYQFAGNKPIWAVDLDGGEDKWYMRVWNSGPNQLYSLSYDIVEGNISSFVLFGSGVVMPIVNQAHVIWKEGPHPGGAYDPNNNLKWAVPYKFKFKGVGMELISQEHLMYGKITLDEGKEVIGASVDVFLTGSPKVLMPFSISNKLLRKVADESADAMVKEIIIPDAISGAIETIQLPPITPVGGEGGTVPNQTEAAPTVQQPGVLVKPLSGPAPNEVVPKRDITRLDLFPWMTNDEGQKGNQSNSQTGVQNSRSPHAAHARRQRERGN
ncbi:RHS repeat domain-containing protein [Chitinophaga barathri]|uniref:RHS repeat-associated core domain-containing protein n=1 Tax=Chitinophaga barathri TaxID=1647451 RepID=A0A3N4MEB8_9BACT|nr:RHS repeat-associated core domain-containing protein [Chitinophaga barathri]RPD38059.1 hypothetical protein EG028_26975 [Chitinophaga barathri]